MESGKFFLLMIAVAALLPSAPNAWAAAAITLTPTENHHIAQLNSNQPYVAGYHVQTPDLYTRERVDATAITVNFPSLEANGFPPDGWLGAGMFVQGQDSKLGFVDYGYYTMLVVDSLGDLYVDIGLHQTRESSAPLQPPTAELVYAYTWQLSGTDPATPVTLTASWDSNDFLHYSISTVETNATLMSIRVKGLPNCESAISKFYAGTAVAGTGFPLGHFVYYFQFGVVSNKIIADADWSAHLEEPRLLRGTEWSFVETALTTQGDVSLLDADWMWGGSPYHGVQAEYCQNTLDAPYEVVFVYTGQTLQLGTILWETRKAGGPVMVPPTVLKQPLSWESAVIVSFEVMLLLGVATTAVYHIKLRKRCKPLILGNNAVLPNAHIKLNARVYIPVFSERT